MMNMPTVIGRAALRYASDADLAPLERPINDYSLAVMDGWHLVHIATAEDAGVHALGYMYGDVYITSPLRALDQSRGTICTRSESVYQLWQCGDDLDMLRPIERHLRRALVVWGYAIHCEAFSV